MNVTAVATAHMFHAVCFHLELPSSDWLPFFPRHCAIAKWPLSVPPGSRRQTSSASGQEFQPGGDLVDNLSVGVESEPDKIERGSWRRSDASAVVGIVGRLEQRLGIDRETDVAADRAVMGAGEFGARGAVDENRLADH